MRRIRKYLKSRAFTLQMIRKCLILIKYNFLIFNFLNTLLYYRKTIENKELIERDNLKRKLVEKKKEEEGFKSKKHKALHTKNSEGEYFFKFSCTIK